MPTTPRWPCRSWDNLWAGLSTIEITEEAEGIFSAYPLTLVPMASEQEMTFITQAFVSGIEPVWDGTTVSGAAVACPRHRCI